MAKESSEAIHGVASLKYANSLTQDETSLLYLLALALQNWENYC